MKTPLTVGVLGGMGPDATVDFMAKVLAATPATDDADHIRMLVDHNPLVPNRQQALLGDGEDPAPAIAAMARGLQKAGADFLVMPCNTAHAYAGAITDAVTIPLVSIIDVSVAACSGHAKVGLLATRGCLAAGLFQQAFAEAGAELLLSSDDEFAELARLVAEIKAGNRAADIAAGMLKLANSLIDRGATIILAGCTEIPLVLDAAMLEVPMVSSTQELAEITIAVAKGQEYPGL